MIDISSISADYDDYEEEIIKLYRTNKVEFNKWLTKAKIIEKKEEELALKIKNVYDIDTDDFPILYNNYEWRILDLVRLYDGNNENKILLDEILKQKINENIFRQTIKEQHGLDLKNQYMFSNGKAYDIVDLIKLNNGNAEDKNNLAEILTVAKENNKFFYETIYNCKLTDNGFKFIQKIIRIQNITLLTEHCNFSINLYKALKDNGYEKFDDFFIESKSQDINKPIDDLDLSIRAYNCLKRAGINTLLELTKMSPEELANVRNLGKKSLDEILQKMSEIKHFTFHIYDIKEKIGIKLYKELIFKFREIGIVFKNDSEDISNTKSFYDLVLSELSEKQIANIDTFINYTNINLNSICEEALSQGININIILDKATQLYKNREKILLVKNQDKSENLVKMLKNYFLGTTTIDEIIDMYKSLKIKK